MARPKVLIIDDSVVDADTIERFLAGEAASDYRVMRAETAEAGLELVASFAPDVVLLDFELPDMDGLEFLRELAASATPQEEMPVLLAVTGQADPRVAAELIRAGADDYVSKSGLTAESVRLAVRQAYRSRRLRIALHERARERERSREELLASLKRASHVASFSEALSKSLSVDAVLSTVAQLAVPALADVCIVDLVEDGRLNRRYLAADDGFAPLMSRPLGSYLPLEAFEGGAKVMRTGVPAIYAKSWLSSLARWDPEVEAALKLGDLETTIVVPLKFDNVVLGTITLLSTQRLDRYAQDVAGELGRRAASALANARLFDAERTAKRQSDEARRRLSLLSSISDVFSRSLEWREAMHEIIALLVPAAADFASISLTDGAGGDIVIASSESAPVRSKRDASSRAMLGHAEFYPDINLMRQYADTGRTLHAVGEAQSGSFIRVPVLVPTGVAEGEIVFSTRGDRRLGIDDLGFVEDIGRRIGMYVETARAFEREREIARSLQQSLLPRDIPPIPGVQFAARCVTGAGGAEVGGDWFDIIPLRDGYVAFAVGDVSGRGVLAAATMGQLRSSLRAYVFEGLGPSDALSRLNAFMLSQDRMEFATVALGILHCATGHVRLSSAGHLPPVFVDSHEGARTLSLRSGLPVGIMGEQRYSEEVFTLERGQSLALFTDGLIESQSHDVDHGTQDLVARLNVASMPEDMLNSALSYLPEDPTDDVTFLALRYLGVGAELIDGEVPRVLLTLPAVPQSAAQVRAHLQIFAERVGLRGMRFFDLQLAVGEAVANAIEHAYNGPQEAIFSVHARAENGQILVDVLDQGRWREGTRTPRGQLSERGRGVGLMRSLCDQVRISRTIVGTRIQLGLSLNGSQADDVLA